MSVHIRVGGLHVVTRVSAGSTAGTYYPHTDHLGSLNVLTNGNGTEVQRLTYRPYGETFSNTGSVDFEQHRYTGQEQDPETGLYFYQARYYNPVLGRFISADSIIPNARPEFQGGGLVRSLGGWAAVQTARRTGAPLEADARILGSGDFVATVLREAPVPPEAGTGAARVSLETLAARLAAGLGVPVAHLFGGSQRRSAVTARQLLVYVWVEVLGRRASDLARSLGHTRGNISTAARRGAAQAARWRGEIPTWCR